MNSSDAFLLAGAGFVACLAQASSKQLLVLSVGFLGWAAWAVRLHGRTSTTRIVQTVVTVWCAFLWILNYGAVSLSRRSMASGLLLVHMTCVITTMLAHDWTPADIISDAAALGFVLVHLPFTLTSWCGLEVFLILTAARDAVDGDVMQHLTWWALLLLAVFDAAIAYDAAQNVTNKIAPLLVPFLRVLSWTVAIGVFVMSCVGCTLLKTAKRDNSAITYILGNFLMHYYPALRSSFAKSSGHSGSRAVGFIAVYAILHDTPDVYGCENFNQETTPILLVVAAVAIATALELFG